MSRVTSALVSIFELPFVFGGDLSGLGDDLPLPALRFSLLQDCIAFVRLRGGFRVEKCAVASDVLLLHASVTRSKSTDCTVMTHGIELDQQHLRELKHEEEADENEEIPPPQIGNIQSVARAQVGRARYERITRCRSKQRTDLIRAESIAVHT